MSACLIWGIWVLIFLIICPWNLVRNASKALSGLTPKKPRKERGPKLAFKMEIDVDVIDDGYKWRKYGQKAVKNSPYPRYV